MISRLALLTVVTTPSFIIMKYNYVYVGSFLGALLYQLLEDTLVNSVSALGLVGYNISSIQASW